MPEAARTRAQLWAVEGLQVVGIATAGHSELPPAVEIEHSLTLLGLDPPRDAAQDTAVAAGGDMVSATE